jgi:hypothetical protein
MTVTQLKAEIIAFFFETLKCITFFAKKSPLTRVLSKLNTVHIFVLCLSNFYFNIMLSYASSLLIFWREVSNLFVLPIRASCPAHFILPDRVNNSIWRWAKLQTSLHDLLRLSVPYFSCLNIFLRDFVLKYLPTMLSLSDTWVQNILSCTYALFMLKYVIWHLVHLSVQLYSVVFAHIVSVSDMERVA